ncbi:hypothetical protein Ancab_040581 [Ancistrocladus abbreviatus]
MAMFLAFFLMLLASAAADCTNCTHHSKATYFSMSSVPYGACGYGSLALNFYGGHVAAAAPSLYQNGAACGACFQVRCSNKALCTKTGTNVILTDQNHSNTTDFILSSRAFRTMAKNDMDKNLLQLGVADVQYKRIPCEFKKQNLSLRVEEFSKYPNYLAVKVLYQGGQTDIFAMDVAQMELPNWTFMSRNYGAVWDSNMVPSGPLQFRFALTSGYDGKYVYASNSLPANWKSGVVYDIGIQITDIAQNSCSPPCADINWNK